MMAIALVRVVVVVTAIAIVAVMTSVVWIPMVLVDFDVAENERSHTNNNASEETYAQARAQNARTFGSSSV